MGEIPKPDRGQIHLPRRVDELAETRHSRSTNHLHLAPGEPAHQKITFQRAVFPKYLRDAAQ